MLLSDEDVQIFLRNILNIIDADKKYSEDKLSLLKEITLKFQQNIPFQNLSLLATNFKDRCLPTDESIREDYLSGVGGLCYAATVFVQELLSKLGYETFRVACTLPHTKRELTHVACIVTDVTKIGDNYFIDPGAGYPSFEPVSLNQLPQKFDHSFLEYKFVREKDGSIARYHKIGNFFGKLPAHIIGDNWQKFYFFREIPRDDDAEWLKYDHTPLYVVPDFASSWYLKGLKITLYPENGAILLNNYVLKFWSEKLNEMKKVELQNSSELEAVIRMHFPKMKGIDVQKAISHWKELLTAVTDA